MTAVERQVEPRHDAPGGPVERDLGGGLVLRTATEADVEAVLALNIDAFGEHHRSDVSRALRRDDVGPGGFTVVADGDRVVSSLCLIPERLRLSGVELPASRVEYVVTLPDYRRRGLVRAQFDVVHEWAARRGDLVTMVAGIPYYYRRFGYEYAIGWGDLLVPRWRSAARMPEGWTVRTAGEADVGHLVRLHELAQAAADLVLLRTPADWRFAVTGDARNQVWVAEEGGRVRATLRVQTEDGEVWLVDGAAEVLDGARALLAAARERLTGVSPVFSARAGTTFGAGLGDHTVRHDQSWATYARIPDPVAFLERIRPVLSARIAASPYRHERGELVVSLYARGLALAYAEGEVTGVRWVDGVEDPSEDGGVGVPPDLVATLLLGRYGAAGLAQRYDDVLLGSGAGLMEALFPRLAHDVEDFL